MTTPALELAGVHKQFGALTALHDVTFRLAPGTLHALLGENGAGKSTLMHIAYGMVQPDRGTILVNGTPQRIRTPRDARAAGIGMVHQHATSVPSFTVAENVALVAGWPARPAEAARRVQALSERLQLPLDPAALADRLSVSLKQRLEIVKALAADASILLLDEPTAVLAPGEAEALLQRIREFTRQGGSAVLITHRLDEALAHADAITVLRRGAVTLEGVPADLTPRDLATAMVGPDAASLLEQEHDRVPAPGDAPVAIRGIALELRAESGSRLAVRDVSLEVRAGEIVGVAAVEGNGQRELLRALAGVWPVLRGRVETLSPLSFIPEDRTTEGLIPSLSLTENMVLGLGGIPPWTDGRRIRWTRARERTAQLVHDLSISAPGVTRPVAALSGGNQQKLVLARALERKPAAIIAEDPTRGLDVAAARAIHDRLRAAADAGAGILVYSSDLDEILDVSDRIVVMRGGKLSEVDGQRSTVNDRRATRDLLGRIMLGAE
ncbi:MAG TPA: ABC transporter ATP-binding protein [Gemmatimonadales bacterium]|nr:ABC transporter ATP-binding protein [Gemmatimonadales bacterium]